MRLEIDVSDNLRKGSRDKKSVMILQLFLNMVGSQLLIDGNFGPTTEVELKKYQKLMGLTVDGVVGPKTWESFSVSKKLTEKDFLEASKVSNLDVALIKTICEVESVGDGFVSGLPRILFEGHIFWSQLQKHGVDPNKHVLGNENILYESWTKKYYYGGAREWDRFTKASNIHKEAAMMSASYGLFQIMGFNYKLAGYDSVEEFFNGMFESEARHLAAFLSYIQNRTFRGEVLIEYLRRHDWDSFAYAYNGPRHEENQYVQKMKSAFNKYSKES